MTQQTADEQTADEQTADERRFAILSRLGDGGAGLMREFEQSLNEERQQNELQHPYVFTDRRAEAIAEAHQRVDMITSATHQAADLDAHLASLKDAMAAKTAAYALPEHEYECALCSKVFVSPARMILVVAGCVDHDAEGNVTTAKTFQKPACLVFCPDCKVQLGTWTPNEDQAARPLQKRRKRNGVRD